MSCIVACIIFVTDLCPSFKEYYCQTGCRVSVVYMRRSDWRCCCCRAWMVAMKLMLSLLLMWSHALPQTKHIPCCSTVQDKGRHKEKKRKKRPFWALGNPYEQKRITVFQHQPGECLRKMHGNSIKGLKMEKAVIVDQFATTHVQWLLCGV